MIWQTVHEDLHKNARVRAVMAFLAEVLSGQSTVEQRGSS